MKNSKRGFIKLIVLVIIALFLLKYSGVDINNLATTDMGQKVVEFWNTYIKPVFVQLVNSAISVLQLISSLAQR
ncbi:MAG: hypothetical protein WC797_04055 [Candidatus Paceibacterota bacterium]|jgi:hypothetical protein